MELVELFGVTRPFLQSAGGGKKLLVCLLERVSTRPFLQSHGPWRFGSIEGGCYVLDNRGDPGDIFCSSPGVAYASRSDMLAGWPCNHHRLQAFPFATSACGRAGSLCHRNIADSLHEDRVQTDAHNARMESQSSWLPPWRRKTINLSARRMEKAKSGRIKTGYREAKVFCVCKMEEKPTAY